MHNQVLIIYPENVDIEDIMYYYQEIDKTIDEKIADARCQFCLTLKEEDIPKHLDKIKKHLEYEINEKLEILQYRTNHTVKEVQDKYYFGTFTFSSYTYYIDELKRYEKVKDLPLDNPELISFIKDKSYDIDNLGYDIYIKGIGYGTFDNPYSLWDYYTIVNERRFHSDVRFLIASDDVRYNRLMLDVLDVPNTISHIKQLTEVWNHIIFCEKDPADSKLYTIDDIRFDKGCNKHCIVDNLADVLLGIQKDYFGQGYMITALDFHW